MRCKTRGYGTFATGPLKHHALVGVELSRYQYGEQDSYAPVAPVNIYNPQPRPAPDPGSFLPILFQTATAPGVGLYYQDSGGAAAQFETAARRAVRLGADAV